MENANCRILLIEDNELDQMAFMRMVKEKQLPYDCTTADSVSEAKNVLASESFDTVIVDYLLGDGTAFDVFDFITDTPIIFATGAGNEELAVKAIKVGAYDYLIKEPGRNYLKVLPEIIKNAIRHKKAEDELKKYHDNLESLVRERTEQLASEKELLAVTLASMSDGVVAVDAEGRIMLFNSQAENLTGWKFEHVQGRRLGQVLQLINEQTKELIENPVDRVVASGKMETGTEHDALIDKYGNEHPVSVTAAPIRKGSGLVIGIVMVIRDVSREREIERMRTDFISSVSHELRTPLTSIKAYIATIIRNLNMPEQTRRQFLSIIDEESNRLGNLIESLLEVSKIEAKAVKIAHQNVNVVTALEQVLSALRPLADEKNIQLETNIDDELIELRGDSDKIRSVLINLIDNAIKFTPPKGRVSVSISCCDEELVIRISDTGMGIPKEDLPKIFERFYRVHRPGKQIPGTGLGLAIVDKIVAMHNGKIDVESRPGQGTTFTILLPLKANAKSDAPVI